MNRSALLGIGCYSTALNHPFQRCVHLNSTTIVLFTAEKRYRPAKQDALVYGIPESVTSVARVKTYEGGN